MACVIHWCKGVHHTNGYLDFPSRVIFCLSHASRHQFIIGILVILAQYNYSLLVTSLPLWEDASIHPITFSRYKVFWCIMSLLAGILKMVSSVYFPMWGQYMHVWGILLSSRRLFYWFSFTLLFLWWNIVQRGIYYLKKYMESRLNIHARIYLLIYYYTSCTCSLFYDILPP